MLRIVADENMPLVTELFGHHAQVTRLPGRRICRSDLADVDILLVRSVTRVDAALLEGTPVRFVGSATIGTDHVDVAYLADSGRHFAHAPGCNAVAVAEYVLTALLLLSQREGRPLHGRRLGIVGVGHVGSALAERAPALGLIPVRHDPPRQRRGEPGPWAELEAITDCEFISLHVPLSRDGEDVTWHWLDEHRLSCLRPDAILVNASRGAVVDNAALETFLMAGSGLRVVLDVWEGEPRIRPGLLALTALGSPHIAGYSLDGKRRGSEMIYRACCQFLGWQPMSSPAIAAPAPLRVHKAQPDETSLLALLSRCHDPARDDRALRASLDEPEPDKAFDRLRKDYPERREFSAFTVDAPEAWHPLLATLGFSLAGTLTD